MSKELNKAPVEQAEPASCQGTNCGTTTGDHSSECLAEAAASQGWELKPGDLCGRDCPMRPATVEQAGGDERAAFESRAEDAGSDISRDDFGNYVNVYVQTEWEGWQARAALAQPSLMPPDRGPWHAVKWDGGRRVDLSSDDFEHDVALTVSGDFVEGDKFRYAQELAAWMNAHLAQPSPVQAEQHWPKLEKPAQVGGVRFSAGVSSRLVVEAAQRLYEFESTPEQEAERIERLQAFREQCFEPLGTEFSKVLSDNLPELLSTAQAEQAERPEVVARVVHSTPVVLDHHMRGMAKQAAEAIQVFTGHDSGANLAHRYGEKWWEHLDELRDALLAFAKNAPPAQAQHSVPEGWKLVPMDPTSQMTFVGQSLRYDAVNSIGEIYRQMVAAAPGKEGL
ncbi:hypothetical protein ACGEMM_17775 [Pseudomonas aeruginosa]